METAVPRCSLVRYISAYDPPVFLEVVGSYGGRPLSPVTCFGDDASDILGARVGGGGSLGLKIA